MQYRTFTNMHALIRANIHRIPRVDCVVGIPRSGMLPASQIATMTNQPLASANELLMSAWRPSKHGGRWGTILDQIPIKRILLVDDSISGGQTMNRVSRELCIHHPELKITTLAIFRKEHSPVIDIALETVPGPRVFEWNWFRHPFIKKAVFDIDGVISTPTVPGDRSVGEPLWIPTHPVFALATGRREEDRAATEAWLAKHGVQYSKLFMSNEQRRAVNTKVEAVLETGATWIVESSVKQAAFLKQATGRPVLCTDANVMF